MASKPSNTERSRMKSVREVQLGEYPEVGSGAVSEVARCAVQAPRCCSGSDDVALLRDAGEFSRGIWPSRLGSIPYCISVMFVEWERDFTGCVETGWF